VNLVVALVLISAFLHAGWNALLRIEPDKDSGVIGAVAVASLFAGTIAVARWAAGEPAPFPTLHSLTLTIVAGIFEAIYFSTLALALEAGPLGAVYTISRGGAVLVVWPVSIAVFGEAVTWTSGAGSVVVLAGLVLAGLGAQGGRRHATDARTGVAWAIACAGSIAGYHLAYKGALSHGAGPSASFALSLALAAVISCARSGRHGGAALVDVMARRGARIVLMGLVCGGSFLILMEALALGGSGYVLTLRNTSVLFAAGLAFAIGERPGRAELVGAALVAGGAVLMSL
jgi:drug/metabolite transporter (DMT)-like permease